MILDYVRGFLTLFLLVKVLLYFVPKNIFEKYIAFFSGVILVIGLLYPLLQGLGQEEWLLEKIQYANWEEELLEIAQDAEELKIAGEEVLTEYYNEIAAEESKIESIVVDAIKIEKEIQAGVIDE